MLRLKQPRRSPLSESAPQHMTMAPGWNISITCKKAHQATAARVKNESEARLLLASGSFGKRSWLHQAPPPPPFPHTHQQRATCKPPHFPLPLAPHLGHNRLVYVLVAGVIHAVLQRHIDRVVLALGGTDVIQGTCTGEELAVLVEADL